MSARLKSAKAALQSRYQPVDYVSEFQKYWSYLNKFYNEAFSPPKNNPSNEQSKLEAIKKLGEVNSIVSNYVSELKHFDNIELSSINAYDENHPREIIESHLIFNHRNALTRFVKAFSHACKVNPAVAKGLKSYRNNSALPNPCLIYLDYEQYRHLYSSGKRGWEVSEIYPSMDMILQLHGLQYLGKIVCSSGQPAVTSVYQSPKKAWLKVQELSELNELVKSANVRKKAKLTEDVIQYLYITRNAAMHGELDYTNPVDNELSQNALLIVRDLIEEII